VVAAEVKALASQTAKATDEIGQQIAGIQTAIQESVAYSQEINATINRISEISWMIADAMEEQGSAMQRDRAQCSAGCDQNRTSRRQYHAGEPRRVRDRFGLGPGALLCARAVDRERAAQEVERFLTKCAPRERRPLIRPHLGAHLRAQRVDGDEAFGGLDVPEGPAVARFEALR